MDEQGSLAPVQVDEELFEDLYTRYATDVLRMCAFYLGDKQQAEDVTQEVFLKLYTAKPSLIPGHEKSWLLKVALNKCKDLWRSKWLRRMVLGSPMLELTPAPDTVEDFLDRQSLLQAVSSLPPDYKEVVLLFYYQGCKLNEISQLLDIPEGTVSSRLTRARMRLEEMLKKEKEK